MWEVKNDDVTDNPHHHQHRFTWYNSTPQENAGNIGDWNQQGDDCFGYDAKQPRSYCHIEQFASRVNKQGLCGYSDWRVPTRDEVANLIHFGRYQPTIDVAYFPHTLDTFYWVNNPHSERPIEAWSVDFEFGTTSPMRKTDKRPVRLVRGQKHIVQHSCQQPVFNKRDYTGRYGLDDDNNVVDQNTGLTWRRCLEGQRGEACQHGEAVLLNWSQALSAVLESGWRLPNIRELASLTDVQCSNPVLNLEVFPHQTNGHLCSSSVYQFYDHYAWYVDMADGIFIYGDRQDKKHVRLVKDSH